MHSQPPRPYHQGKSPASSAAFPTASICAHAVSSSTASDVRKMSCFSAVKPAERTAMRSGVRCPVDQRRGLLASLSAKSARMSSSVSPSRSIQTTPTCDGASAATFC